jgi:serine/threonine protein phosphatase PrpC
VWGRPSPAAGAGWKLRGSADAASAAYRADGGEWGNWSVRAATAAGVRHRLAGLAAEDAYGWAVLGGDALVLTVADGVGSMPGAAGAALTAVRAAGGIEPEPAGAGLLDSAVAAVEAANLALAGHPGSTTLVVAVLAGAEAALARVGDSSAMLLSGEQWLELWPAPADDEVDTATAALPADLPVVDTAEVALGRDDVLVLLTDGVAVPLRDGPTTVAPALASVVAGCPSPRDLLDAADFSRQGCHDDRTIVAAWHRFE